MLRLGLVLSISVVTLYLLARTALKIPTSDPAEEAHRVDRWAGNFSFEVVNQTLAFAIGHAISQLGPHWLFPTQRALNGSAILAIALAILGLDFVFYWRHRFYHRFLMGIHRIHHPHPKAGEGSVFDLTLSLRIHPFEMLIQMAVFLGCISALGLDRWQAAAVNATFTLQAFLSHLELPILSRRLSLLLSKVWITPEYHRRHHEAECGRHFGFLFSFWDRLFKTEDRHGWIK